MNLLINFNNDVTFKTQYKTVIKSEMSEVLLPMLQKPNMDLKTMVASTGFTNNAICNWFIETFGVSAAKYFRAKRLDLLKKEFLELNKNQTTIEDIAKKYGCSKKWAYNHMVKFGLKTKNADKEKLLDKTVLQMVNDGLPVNSIAERCNCSRSKIQQWLNKNLDSSIVRYRRENNIKLLSKGKHSEILIAESLQKYFDAGYSQKEASEHFNISMPKIVLLKRKYNIKTFLDHANNLLDKFLPDFVEFKERIPIMSRIVGLSEATIARRIKSLYGKNYIDIKMER